MILHIILGLLLLLIPAGLLYYLERKMLRPFLVAVARMGVQLLVLCLVIWALYKFDSPWLLVVWLVLIAVGSGVLVLKRSRQKGLRLLPAVSGGLLVSVAFVTLWLLALVLPVRVFDPRWFVPVTGLLMGHATAMTIRGLSTYLSALKADEQQYEFLRVNGQSACSGAHLDAFVARRFALGRTVAYQCLCHHADDGCSVCLRICSFHGSHRFTC